MGKAYWKTIQTTLSRLWHGMRITFRHFRKAARSPVSKEIHSDNYFTQNEGLTSVQYPHESLPVPDNGRYRLHNEIDDCIVCDKCAKICPVDCIEIEAIKAPEVFGTTSDGTPKRIYAARFDIDMGKCCFCGLCTTVCPTECLTMTKAYDFSEYDVIDHIYSFAEMSREEIDLRRKESDQPVASSGEKRQITDKDSGQPAITPGKKND